MFCKTCGSYYTKSLGVCPKCNAAEKLQEYQQSEANSFSGEPRERLLRRRWITLIIGIPGLIAFLYLMSYIMKLLMEA